MQLYQWAHRLNHLSAHPGATTAIPYFNLARKSYPQEAAIVYRIDPVENYRFCNIFVLPPTTQSLDKTCHYVV